MNKPILVILISGALLAGCSGKKADTEVQAAKKAEPVQVKVARAERRRVERTIPATGTLFPDETVSVSSEVAGRVATVAADFGQTVKEGQVIAELDKQEFQLQLDRSRAALAQALARLGLNPDQENQRPETTPAVRQARAQYEDARSKYESAKKLFETGDIARERYTELEQALAAHKAAVDAAEDDVRTQWANIAALRAERAMVEKRIRDATVRAPFDGQVKERLVSPGQYTKENTPLFTLVKVWPLRLRMDVPETAAGAVKMGDTLRFTTEAVPGKTFTAVVQELNPSLDARSRSLSAEARIQSGDPGLRPGMFVQVELVMNAQVEVVVVPKDAVYTVAGLTKLFTIKGNVAKEHRIAPGQIRNGWMEVPSEEVHAGDQVALDQVQVLTDGAEVRPQS